MKMELQSGSYRVKPVAALKLPLLDNYIFQSSHCAATVARKPSRTFLEVLALLA